MKKSRNIFIKTLPKELQSKYKNDSRIKSKSIIDIDIIFDDMRNFLINEAKERKKLWALCNKNELARLFEEAKRKAQTDKQFKRIKELEQMPKVSLKDYITFNSKNELCIDFEQISILDDAYFNKIGL